MNVGVHDFNSMINNKHRHTVRVPQELHPIDNLIAELHKLIFQLWVVWEMYYLPGGCVILQISVITPQNRTNSKHHEPLHKSNG